MNRVKINEGSRVKLSNILENLQDYFKTNLNNRILNFIKSFGIINDTNINLSVSNNLLLQNKYTVTNKNRFSILPGTAILQNGEQITITDETINDLSVIYNSTLEIDSYYLIKLQFLSVGVEPVAVMSSFVFDPTGADPYSQRYSTYEDSFLIKAVKVIDGDTDYLVNNVNTDEVVLGILKTDSVDATKILTTSFTFNDLTSTLGIIDLRGYNALKISKDLLSDSDVILKDRDSVDNQKLNGSLETAGYIKSTEVKINSDEAGILLQSLLNLFKILVNGDTDGALSIFPVTTNTPIKITDKDDNIIAYFDTVNKTLGIGKIPNLSTLDISGTFTASDDVTSIKKLSGANIDVNIGDDHYGHIKFVSSDTIFDLFTKDNNNNDGKLTLQPVTNNRPIQITDKDNNIIAYFDTANNRLGIKKIPGSYDLDVLGTGNFSGQLYSLGKKVMLEPIDVISPDILNFRINDVSGNNNNTLKVNFKWGYDYITGTGGLNTFTISNTGLSFVENELAGYYLFITATKVNLKIVSNAVTVGNNTILTVSNIDDSNWNGVGLTTTSTNPAWIHSNASSYTIVAIPMDPDTDALLSDNSIYNTINKDLYITEQTLNLVLTVDVKYTIKIMGKKDPTILDWQSLTDGSYIKYSVTQNYVHPYIAQHPLIGDDGVLSASGIDGGYMYELTGWEEAEEFDYYTDTEDIISFPDSGFITSTSRNIVVNPAPANLIGETINIAARPKISKQVVGSVVTDSTLVGLVDFSSSILNYRISNIKGAGALGKLQVQLKWGYDGLIGSAINSQITITSGLNVTLDQLKNQFIYLPGAGKNLVIVSNAATVSGNTVLTVTDLEGNDWNDSVTITTATAAWIHQNAEEYLLTAIPVVGGADVEDESIDLVIKSGSPVTNSALITLNLGVSYKFKIKAIRGSKFIDWQTMIAGSYIKYSATQNYSSPALISHATIPSDGTITPTGYVGGYSINISGWTDAEQYQLVWTTGTPDFNNTTQQKTTINVKNTNIPASNNTTYNIKARPLIAGQVVGSEISTSVTTGSPYYMGALTKNLRITDIYGVGVNGKLGITFNWNYLDIVGVGGSGTFTETAGAYNWSSNELINYHIYLPDGTDLLITGNTASSGGSTIFNVILADTYATWNGTGYSTTSGNPAYIHQNINNYFNIYLTPMSGSTKLYDKRLYYKFYVKNLLIPNKSSFSINNLDAGQKYEFVIQGISDDASASETYLAAGSFVKYESTISYNANFTLNHPALSGTVDDGTLTLAATSNGFTIKIDGWDEAEQYQYALTTDNGGASFANPNHVKDPVTSKTIDITVSEQNTYYVAVRGLIGGQVVTDSLAKSILAGTSNKPPESEVIYSGNISRSTASGTITTVTSGGGSQYTLSITGTIRVPAESSYIGEIDSSNLSNLQSAYMTIGTSEFRVVSVYSTNVIVLRITGTYVPLDGDTFEANTSKTASIMHLMSVSRDYQVQSISVTNVVKWGQVTTLRVYQQNYETDADHLDIEISGLDQIVPGDTKILYSRGNRVLVVDAWDEGGLNQGNFSATLTITARPI